MKMSAEYRCPVSIPSELESQLEKSYVDVLDKQLEQLSKTFKTFTALSLKTSMIAIRLMSTILAGEDMMYCGKVILNFAEKRLNTFGRELNNEQFRVPDDEFLKILVKKSAQLLSFKIETLTETLPDCIDDLLVTPLLETLSLSFMENMKQKDVECQHQVKALEKEIDAIENSLKGLKESELGGEEGRGVLWGEVGELGMIEEAAYATVN